MDADARKAGLERMRAYVAALQPLLRLAHWEIVIGEGQAPDAMADCCVYMHEHKAELRFSDRYFVTSIPEQQQVAVHEMLHIVVEHWHRSGLAVIEFLDPTSQLWSKERHDYDMEMAVDALSRIIAPHMPLPPDADKEAA